MNLKNRSALAVIALLIFVVYASSLANDFVSWDDGLLVYKNPVVQNFDVAKAFTSYDPELYVPLTLLTYQIEYALFGLDASYYHATNLFLHIGSALLVYLFLFHLTKKQGIALTVALIFGLHPINTEAVAWVSARKDVLSTFFFFGSLLTYVRYQERQWIAVLLFACALLSKVSPILLPFILLLIDYYNDQSFSKKAFISKWPYFSLSLIFGLIALFGKSGNVSSIGLLETKLLALKSIVFGIEKVVLPLHLSVIYPQQDTVSLSEPFVAFSVFFFLLLAAVIYKRRSNKDLLFGFGFYFLMLIPSFATFAKGDEVYFFSDRYVYMSMIGLVYVLAVAMASILPTLKYRIVGASVVIFLAALLSFQRSEVWASSQSLYENALVHYPNSPVVHYNLGLYHQDQNQMDTALQHYQPAIKLKPSYADAYNNIGVIHMDRGNLSIAEIHFDAALEKNPSHIRALNNLGTLYGKQGKYEEGLKLFLKAMELDPSKKEEAEKLRNRLYSFPSAQ